MLEVLESENVSTSLDILKRGGFLLLLSSTKHQRTQIRQIILKEVN